MTNLSDFEPVQACSACEKNISKCSIQTFLTDKKKTGNENTTATLYTVMQMFSNLRAIEDLEPLPLPEAEVILGPGLIVIQSHKQSHPCRKTKKK